MKNLITIPVLILTVFFLSCGKDKKPEFTDEETGSKSETNVKKEESKQDEKKETDSDSVKQNTGNRTNEYKGNNFSNEKPVAVISPLEAGDYNGKTVTVKGFVADVYQSEKVAYLNFVEKFPKNPFTAVIFASKFSDFPDIVKYRNKEVEVTGRVSIFKDKPQIILNSPKQIVVK
jgi:DNA/RNA endonuclease YhcR with UshA esterase domain